MFCFFEVFDCDNLRLFRGLSRPRVVVSVGCGECCDGSMMVGGDVLHCGVFRGSRRELGWCRRIGTGYFQGWA